MPRWKAQPAWLVAVALTASCGSAPAPAPAAAPAATESTQVAAEPGDAEARAALRKRMRHHARDMHELVWAVLLLDYPGARKWADTVAAEAGAAAGIDEAPSAGAPAGASGAGTGAEAAAVPAVAGTQSEGFRRLTAHLRNKALEVSSAAAVRDARRMSEAYSGLSQICIDCHAVYRPEGARGGPPSARP